ncbi:MAG: gas vesicle protein GvpO [Gaiellaceae bacterium]
MADLTDAQRKRAEARQRRRSQSDDAPDEPEPSADGGGEEAHHAVKQAAKVAAAVGAAGAAAAAAKALTSHADDEVADRLEPEEPASESEEPQQPEQPDEQTEQEPEQAAEEPVAGAGTSEARQVIDRAREQLQDLLERPVESVSSLERTHDGWVAQLEVVELKRVPESTDVLASYELELDDELNLRRYQQARRYTRSQSSGGEGP